MKTLYTDAGYTWQHSLNVEVGEEVRGRICVADKEGFSRVEIAGIIKVPVLKQYINVFELIAIARSIEIAIEKGWTGSLAIKTDSKVAMIWASSGKVANKVSTEAHQNALEYLRTARKNYIGIVTFNHVGRDHNPAGKLLEIELEKDRALRKSKEEDEKEEEINRGKVNINSGCVCGCHLGNGDGDMTDSGCDICIALH